jgi:hypothetical protein
MTTLSSISRSREEERGVAILNNVTNSQRSGALTGQDSVSQAPPIATRVDFESCTIMELLERVVGEYFFRRALHDNRRTD